MFSRVSEDYSSNLLTGYKAIVRQLADGMTLIQAFIRNTGSPKQMPSERHKRAIPVRPNSKAVKDDG